MKKLHGTRNFLTGVLTTILVIALATPVLAALTPKTIDVSTGAEIYIDGVKLNPTDGNGNPVETFIYNGTTYIPLRAVSQSLGKAVNWDGANQRVYIGEVPGQKQYLLDVCPPYKHTGFTYGNGSTSYNIYSSPVKGTFLMGGNTYSYGFAMEARSDNSTCAYFNLNGQYKSLTCTLGIIDSSSGTAKVSFIVDGTVVAQYDLSGSNLPFEVTVPLNYGLQLQIMATKGSSHTKSGIGNIIVE